MKEISLKQFPKPGQLKAVALDLDGLMVNTEDIYDQVLTRLLQRRGYAFDLALKRAMMGLKAEDALAALRQRIDIRETAAELHLEVAGLFQQLIDTQLKLMPGLTALLRALDARGIPRGVATSSPRPLAAVTLARAGLEAGFQFILTGDDVERGKPAPDIYLRAAERFGIAATEMLVFEDSLNGSLAAAGAGAYTVVVPSSQSDGLDFSHAQAIVPRLSHPWVNSVIQEGFR